MTWDQEIKLTLMIALVFMAITCSIMLTRIHDTKEEMTRLELEVKTLRKQLDAKSNRRGN